MTYRLVGKFLSVLSIEIVVDSFHRRGEDFPSVSRVSSVERLLKCRMACRDSFRVPGNSLALFDTSLGFYRLVFYFTRMKDYTYEMLTALTFTTGNVSLVRFDVFTCHVPVVSRNFPHLNDQLRK